MKDFKAIKQRARQHVKRHWFLLAVVCAISVFMGTEFNSVVSNAQAWYDVLTDRVTQLDTEGFRENDEQVTNTIIDGLIYDNMAAGQEAVAERMRQLKAATAPNSPLGRQRGVLAAAVNSVASGQLFAMAGTAMRTIMHSGELAAIVLILGSTLLYALVWIFLRNMYGALMRRIFLETRTYKVFPLYHFLHIRLVNRWTRASLTMLLEAIYEALWALTLVGWVIKRYSYFLVPYIVAENPDIKPRQAITLSRRMMNGHKWECCKLELSFVGWMILGFLTFGAAEVLWGIPYRLAAYSEFYAGLREEAKVKGIEGAELLNDGYLYAHANPGELQRVYADIVAQDQAIQDEPVDLTRRQRFFARNFGIWLGSLSQKKAYAHREGLKQQVRVAQLELNGEAYPERLNALWNRKNATFTGRVSYLSPCTVWTLVVVFFAFCMVGWLWEVSLHLITHGEFVNRGALHGPWLPIYGGGVVLIEVLLYRFRNQPIAEALAITVLCGVVEYTTSWALEMMRGMRWWDYTGYFLNLNGRISGEGLAMFAVGGMAAVYILVPIIDAMLTRVRKPRVLVAVCVTLLICFSCDFVYSQFVPNIGAGITDDEKSGPVESARAYGNHF